MAWIRSNLLVPPPPPALRVASLLRGLATLGGMVVDSIVGRALVFGLAAFAMGRLHEAWSGQR